MKENPADVLDDLDDGNKVNLDLGTNPYGVTTPEENVFKKDFSESNGNGVIIFEVPLDKIKTEGLKKMRVKVTNIDYESSRYSEVANIVRQNKA